jgi:hypothetical protein
VEVVIAQDTAVAGEGVLVQAACLPVVAERREVAGEIVGAAQGVGVVFALESSASAQSVLVEVAGLLVLAERAKVGGQVVR